MSVLFMICGVCMNNSLILKFNICSAICVSYNGEEYVFENGSDEYDKIMSTALDFMKNSHEMPALGVSLDNETKSAKKTGLWLELKFNKTLNYLDMPFDSLLINIEKGNSGCNIIRGNNGVYEGRCYYLNHSKTMDTLYDNILSIINTQIKP